MDPIRYYSLKLDDLQREVDKARLAAQLPHRPSVVRRKLALACHRLANWLDNSPRYVRPTQSGPAHWARNPANTYIWETESVTPPAARDFKPRPTDQFIKRWPSGNNHIAPRRSPGLQR